MFSGDLRVPSVWAPNASPYASSTCVHQRLLACPFDQGFTAVPGSLKPLIRPSVLSTDYNGCYIKMNYKIVERPLLTSLITFSDIRLCIEKAPCQIRFDSKHIKSLCNLVPVAMFGSLVVILKEQLALTNYKISEHLQIGPLQDPVTQYRINYTGTQITQWDFQNKGKSRWTGTSSFVLKVPLRYLRPSVIYSVPCDRILQRAYQPRGQTLDKIHFSGNSACSNGEVQTFANMVGDF